MSAPDPTDELFSLSVPVKTRYLGAIRGFFQRALEGACGEHVAMLILALDESCSNVMRHRTAGAADPDRLRLEARVRPGHVRFDIRDFCCREDVSKIKPRELADVRPHGLGTFLVREIMDRVEFVADEEHPGRMILVMEKDWAVEDDRE